MIKKSVSLIIETNDKACVDIRLTVLRYNSEF